MDQNYLHNIQQSFNKACEKEGQQVLAEKFFERFFATYPETQNYFSNTDISSFATKKLIYVYDFFVDVVAHPNFAEGKLAEEVIRHQGYGLKDAEYYFILIDCLADTVQKALGEDNNEAITEAWRDVATAFKAYIQQAADTYL